MVLLSCDDYLLKICIVKLILFSVRLKDKQKDSFQDTTKA